MGCERFMGDVKGNITVYVEPNVEYAASDVDLTCELHKYLHNRVIQTRIESIRRQMDICDDIYERSRLARKILRLKNRLY